MMYPFRIFLVVVSFLFIRLSLAQESVFVDLFDDNENEWMLINNQQLRSQISNGTLNAQNNGQQAFTYSQYVNRLDVSEDFSVEAEFKVDKGAYGITWGGIDHQNAYFFVVDNFTFALLETSYGQVITKKEYSRSIKIRPNKNILKVERKGGFVRFYINDAEVHEMPFVQVKGNMFGINVWGNSSTYIDRFEIRGRQKPILEAPDLFYTEAPENLKTVNSIYDEMTPVISANGKRLYFSRAFDPQNNGGGSDYQDVYVSEWSGSNWLTPQNISVPVNNSAPNAVNAVSPDGNTLLLINTYEANGKPKGMGLSMSKRTKNGWSIPEDVAMQKFYNKSNFNEFFLSNDGMVILMAVEREGTEGSRDLYASFYRDGIWSQPKSLGRTINTPGTELSPFLASDGKTLYFSSNGHPGYGKNDVFISKRLDDSWTHWSEPMNIGKPINTKGRNAYYSVPASGDYAYYVSDENSLGKGDIFKIKLPSAVKPEPIVLVKGFVRNAKTKAPLGTAITITDLETGKVMGIANSSPADGYYEIVLPLGTEYSFFAKEEGFYSIRELQEVKAGQELYTEVEQDLLLKPVEIGEPILMRNVLFYQAKSVLRSGSYGELNELVALLVKSPTMRIEVDGHTDNVGNPDLNQKLSEERALTVKAYLVDKGIDASRIETKGFGGSKPAFSNNQESTRLKNRRVEFVVLEE